MTLRLNQKTQKFSKFPVEFPKPGTVGYSWYESVFRKNKK